MFAKRAGAVTVVATGLLLAGCGLPEGLDGEMTSQWAPLAEPVQFVPETAVCHELLHGAVGINNYQPISCDEQHRWETFHVSEFTGEAAERHSVPPVGSPEMREAFRECDEEAVDHLGADFRHGPLSLTVVTPREAAWQGGARWFRCDLMQWRDFENRGDPALRSGSLSGALADEGDLRLGCFNPDFEDDWVESMNPVDCDEPHTAEFVGVWTAPDTSYLDPSEDEDSGRMHRECRSVVADYVGVPDNADMGRRAGTIYSAVSAEQWDGGDRGIRCYVWLDEEWTGSLAGAGTSGLPLR